ncbi:MAG: class I SAM-dependent methyltransferase [Candidatus Manganitrophaceae bacterium]
MDNQGFWREAQIFGSLIAQKGIKKVGSFLVVGCGDGTEAAILAEVTGTKLIIGIDSIFAFSDSAKRTVSCALVDATALPFLAESFDVVYCYHVLEHILEYKKVIAEVMRVLRKGGLFYVGVPNKRRLIGYVGSARATMKEKIVWNLMDYKKKILGEFENEKGAHAGFYEKELEDALNDPFDRIYPVRDEYYRLKYSHKVHWIDWIISLKLGDLLFPSNYFICIK